MRIGFTPAFGTAIKPKTQPRFGQASGTLNGPHVSDCLVAEIQKHPQSPTLSLNHYLTMLNSPAVEPDDKEASLQTVLTALFKPDPNHPEVTQAKLNVANLLIPHVTRFNTYWEAVSKSSIARISQALSKPAVQYLNSLTLKYFDHAHVDPDSLFASILGRGLHTGPKTAWETALRSLNHPEPTAVRRRLVSTITDLVEEADEAAQPETQHTLMQAASMLSTYVSTKTEATAVLKQLDNVPHVKLDPHAEYYLHSLATVR